MQVKRNLYLFTFIHIVVLNYAHRQRCLLISITNVKQVDGSVADYYPYDLRKVEMLQAQAATGWDVVSVEVKSITTIIYNLQSI
jgi:hypothetical protein